MDSVEKIVIRRTMITCTKCPICALKCTHLQSFDKMYGTTIYTLKFNKLKELHFNLRNLNQKAIILYFYTRIF